MSSAHVVGSNIRVGAQTLGKLVRQHGLAAGIARYNGTGPAAQRYSRQVLQRVAVWTDDAERQASYESPRTEILG